MPSFAPGCDAALAGLDIRIGYAGWGLSGFSEGYRVQGEKVSSSGVLPAPKDAMYWMGATSERMS